MILEIQLFLSWCSWLIRFVAASYEMLKAILIFISLWARCAEVIYCAPFRMYWTIELSFSVNWSIYEGNSCFILLKENPVLPCLDITKLRSLSRLDDLLQTWLNIRLERIFLLLTKLSGLQVPSLLFIDMIILSSSWLESVTKRNQVFDYVCYDLMTHGSLFCIGKCNPIGTVLLIERNIPADLYSFPNSLQYIYPLMFVLFWSLIIELLNHRMITLPPRCMVFY